MVLNTNLYYSSNGQTASMADPGQQFQWLGDVLSNASRDGEMVSAPASSCAPGLLPESSLPLGILEGPVSAYPRGGFRQPQQPCELRTGNPLHVKTLGAPRSRDGLITQ